MKKYFIGLLIVLALTYWSVRPILINGYFSMHDDTQVARVVEMKKALAQGQFPVRWVSDLGYGYGYPLFNFYGPLPYYVGGFFYLLGVDPVVSTKLVFLLGMLLPGVTMYLLIASSLGVVPGIVAALFYIYSPYHAIQLYVRGSIGELWVNMFFPLLLYGFIQIIKNKQKKMGVFLVASSLASISLSHTIYGYVSFMLVGFGVALYALIQKYKKKLFINSVNTIILSVLIGLSLSAFFWLPAISEMKYTSVAGQIGATANFRDHFVCLNQLWESAWGFGGSAKGCIDGLSFRLGKAAIILAGASMLLVMRKYKDESNAISLGLFAISISLFSLFMLTNISLPIWLVMPMSSYVQYPWRFLSLTSFGMSILIGVGYEQFSNIRRLGTLFCWILFLVIMLYTNIKLFVPQFSFIRAIGDFVSEKELKYRVSSISDEYLPPGIKKPQSENGIVRGTILSNNGTNLVSVEDKGTSLHITVQAVRSDNIIIQRAYFPGWEYYLNSVKVYPTVRDGLPFIRINPGVSRIDTYFRNTPIRTIGNLVSLLGFVFLILYVSRKSTIT